MTATIHHFGFDVQGIIRMLEDTPYPKRDLKWRDLRNQFEKLKKEGIITASSCPKSIERSPGVWVCPGHPKK